ncbi:hypothetical protein T484DRAFT_3001152 [Baffinella frigidus]|nr:hypothetical protein T484DRAFT_3001152 [Cryptophyta sp. CCMP2293]
MADMMKDAESLRKPEGKEEKAARREKRKLEEAQGDRHAGEDVDGSGAAKDASGVAPKKRKHPKGLPEGSDGKISVGVSPFAMATASRLDDGESDTDSEEEEEEDAAGGISGLKTSSSADALGPLGGIKPVAKPAPGAMPGSKASASTPLSAAAALGGLAVPPKPPRPPGAEGEEQGGGGVKTVPPKKRPKAREPGPPAVPGEPLPEGWVVGEGGGIPIGKDGMTAGRFTKEEDAKLMSALENALENRKGEVKTLEDARAALRGERVEGTVPDKATWKGWVRFVWDEVVLACPGRSRESVYSRGRRLLQDTKRGAWTSSEIARIKELVDANRAAGMAQIQWTEIGRELARPASACRDIFRHKMQHHAAAALALASQMPPAAMPVAAPLLSPAAGPAGGGVLGVGVAPPPPPQHAASAPSGSAAGVLAGGAPGAPPGGFAGALGGAAAGGVGAGGALASAAAAMGSAMPPTAMAVLTAGLHVGGVKGAEGDAGNSATATAAATLVSVKEMPGGAAATARWTPEESMKLEDAVKRQQETRNPKPGTRNLKSDTRNPKPDTRLRMDEAH